MNQLDIEDINIGKIVSQDANVLASVIEALSVTSRKRRQLAASAVSQVSAVDPCCLMNYLDEIIDALDRPEAQTRWECLDALSRLVPLDADRCEKAIPFAEMILFEDEHGIARLAAFRFLCSIGSTTKERSLLIWPLIDEALQCFHGDMEFMDMLGCISSFISGSLHDEVRKKLKMRLSFDAENNKSAIGKRSKTIIANL